MERITLKNFDISGQSLIEVILAVSIFGLIAASIAALSAGAFYGLTQADEQTKATALLQEGLEGARAIRDRAYNENRVSQSGLQINGDHWEYLGENSSESIGEFTRTINLSDVCRDATDAIVTCPGDYTDVHSKKVTITIDWTNQNGTPGSVQATTYITNWDSQDWTENITTDFNDGSFTNTQVSGSLGDGDGAVTLTTQ